MDCCPLSFVPWTRLDVLRHFQVVPTAQRKFAGTGASPPYDGSQGTVRIRYFQSWFPLLVLASWLTAPKASPETIHESPSQMGCGNTNTCVSCVITICYFSLYFLFFTEPGVGLGIGACCLTLENSSPGIYIHSLAPGSVAKMDGRLRLVKAETCWSGFTNKIDWDFVFTNWLV